MVEEVEVERIYIIPLRKYGFKSSKAANTAVKRVRSYLTRHMKVEEDKVWIDDSLNNALWSRGKYNIPHRIRVKAVKFEDGVVEAYLPELEFKKSRRELLKEEKEKKEPILKKEEVEAKGEAKEGEYEIAPTAEGEVKIKKKKAPRKKKPEEAKETKKKPAAKKKEIAKETTEKESKPKKAAPKPKSSKKKPESK